MVGDDPVGTAVTVRLALACAFVGLLIGSFLNVVIHRVPAGESVVRPPSACPGCRHEIRRRDNVPVLSWLVLRGRCRDCRARISVRYPLVEAGTGLLFGIVGWWVGPAWELPAYLYLAAIGVALTMIDLDVRRLPDAIVLPAYPVALLLLTGAAALSGEWGQLLRALIGCAAVFLLYGILFVVKPGGMGFGDVKLSGVLGLYLGWWSWSALAVGTFAAFLLGGVVGLALVVAGRAGRKARIPFGPWMIAGGFLGILVADPVVHGYFQLVGLGDVV